MAVQNSLAKKDSQTKVSLTDFLTKEGVKLQIKKILGDENRSQRFITSVITQVNANMSLTKCEPTSLIQAFLLGESLNLSPSGAMGQYYVLPYNSKKGTVAQFQLGYKGYVQLAIRSGEYKRIKAMSVKKGEFVSWNELTEELEFTPVDNRDELETVGYYATIEMINGYTASMYWSKERMEKHAQKYSKSYNESYSVWKQNFDTMAEKTLLRQLLSKRGVLSSDMQKAYTNDMAEVKNAGNDEPVYVDSIFENSEPVEAEVVETATTD